VCERRLEALSELPGIVIGPEVDKEQAGLLVQHVIVDGGDRTPTRQQSLHNRIFWCVA
jgi:hypothetical protein